jgi:hypothetical protein
MASQTVLDAHATAAAMRKCVEEVGNLKYLGVVGETGAGYVQAMINAIVAAPGTPSAAIYAIVPLLQRLMFNVGNYPYMQYIAGTGADEVDASAIYLDSLQQVNYDADAVLWRTQVIANAGTVSAARFSTIDTLIKALKAAGAWARRVDYFLLAAENLPQANTSLKRTLLTSLANSPVFTPDRGVTFGGTTFMDLKFIPSTQGGGIYTAASREIGCYERTNATAQYAMGVIQGANVDVYSPRIGGNVPTGSIGGSALAPTVTVTTSVGWSTIFKKSGSEWGFRRNGTLHEAMVGTDVATLASLAMYGGGRNNSGSLSNPRTSEIAAFMVGGYADDAVSLAEYDAIQAWATEIGANV